MSLSCDLGDSDCYVEVIDQLTTTPLRHKCVECRKEIAPFEQHYQVHEYRMGGEDDYDDEGNSLEGYEVTIRHVACCEECGDLASSVLELGFCWSYGELRNDIKELNEERRA